MGKISLATAKPVFLIHNNVPFNSSDLGSRLNKTSFVQLSNSRPIEKGFFYIGRRLSKEIQLPRPFHAGLLLFVYVARQRDSSIDGDFGRHGDWQRCVVNRSDSLVNCFA